MYFNSKYCLNKLAYYLCKKSILEFFCLENHRYSIKFI